MTCLDSCRRAACVVLVVVCLILVPGMATAKFTSSKAPTLTVSTDKMETPTGLTGTYRCTRSGSTELMSVTISTFTDSGPRGSTYAYGLALGSTIKDTDSSTSKSITLSASRSYDGSSTTWTVGVQATLKKWTGGIATKAVTCPSSATASGSF